MGKEFLFMAHSIETLSVSFIGAGKMATAIASGMIRAGADPAKIRAYDVSREAGKIFAEKSGALFLPDPAEALEDAGTVVLAVKPQFAAEALAQAGELLKGKLLISIAAGLTLDFLASASAEKERLIRVMPNTPAAVGEGMSCFAASPGAAPEDLQTAELILNSFGRSVNVPEHLMDAVTGLSGSAPAFVLEFICGLADGGVYAGLPRAMALQMAAQTVLGTARMCLLSQEHPESLRDGVISPAGTTARGVMVLEKAGFRGIAAEAVVAAAERSAELGKKK